MNNEEKRNKSSLKFVNLHSHDTFSIFDAIGFPKDYMDFCYKNGMDALAITNHGNMNSMGYQIEYAKKMNKEGKKFKPLFGAELYWIESISDWRKEVENVREKIKEEKQSAVIVEDEEESKNEIKSLLKRRSHLTTLVINQEGLNNIFQMISDSYSNDNFYRYPRIDFSMLEKYNKGLLITSSCLAGICGNIIWRYKEDGEEKIYQEIRKILDRMIDIFGKSRFFGELQWNRIPEQHILNKMIIEFSKEYKFKLISTADCHYPNPSMWKDREIYKRLGVISRDKKPDWFYEKIPQSVNGLEFELYPKNGDQMWESFLRYSKESKQFYDFDIIKKSIEKSYSIAHDLIDDFYPDNTIRLPKFVIPENKQEDNLLAKLCITELKYKGLSKNKKYIKRLKEELHIIKDRKFSKYFLSMKKIVVETKHMMMISHSRGSAGGSLCSYLLGITQIDPLKWNLQFERFLRKDATDMPDIDVDFSDNMKLKEHLIEKWGENSVVPISNFNTLQLRSLIKDISKLYEIPFKEVNNVTSKMIIEATPKAKKRHGITAGVYVPTFEETLEYSDSLQRFLEKYPHVSKHIKNLQGQIKSCSRHAAGVVLGEKLNKRMPIINSGGIKQSPWTEGQTVRHLEPFGFIKFDILGLSTLSMIQQCINNILKNYFNNKNPTFEDIKEFYNKNLHPDIINFDNQEIYKNVFHKGKWAGIFQFSEKGAQDFCQQVKPKSLIDLATITAIYRPGALSSNINELYLKVRNGELKERYEHSILKEILEKTHSFLIFQEQLSEIAHKLGKDISLDEANLLRKVLTKKGTGKTEEVKNRLYDKFINGCIEKGLTKKIADDWWQKMEYFSGYSFNLSHSVGYSIISFQCAYLLTYYPSEWLAAFLDKESETKKEKAISIVRSLGYKIRPLDINLSGREWQIDPNNKKILIQPLTSVKGLGETAIEQIIENRPFQTIKDLVLNEKISYAKLNKARFNVLIKSQALNNFIKNNSEIKNMKHLWYIICNDKKPLNNKQLEERIKKFANVDDFSKEEKIEFLISLTGVYPINLIMKKESLNILEEYKIPPISEYDSDLRTVWFIVKEVLERKTKTNRDYYILNVTDINNVYEKIKIWAVNTKKDKIYSNRPYIADIDYSPQWGYSVRGIRGNFKLLS